MKEEQKVQHLRLVNGEEVLSVIEREDATAYYLSSPMVVAIREDDFGKMTVLMNYIPYNKSTLVPISKAHVITCSDIHEEMERHYFLSLKINKQAELGMLESLRETNSMMEKALVTSPKARKKHVMPGSDKLH